MYGFSDIVNLISTPPGTSLQKCSVLGTESCETQVMTLDKTAPCVCALGWVKCRAQISLLEILCIIVYVTNKKIFNYFILLLIKQLKYIWQQRLDDRSFSTEH